VLTGKPHERILRNHHDAISTWNIGNDLSVNQWRSLFRQLLVYAYLESDIDQYGGLKLTARAKPLLRGEETLMLREVAVVQKKSRATKSKVNLEVADAPLFEALRALRKTLADENSVPPFVIFHDRTLLEMVAEQPQTLSEMAEISGVGEQKLERFGEIFLSAIETHQATLTQRAPEEA
jgi:ATP-dependent DNA helicase RecQ